MGDPGERQLPRVLMGVLAHIDVTDHHKHIRSIEVNNTLFKYIYAHKRDTRYIFEKVDREDPYKRSPKVGAFNFQATLSVNIMVV